jgi:hypothetical protein
MLVGVSRGRQSCRQSTRSNSRRPIVLFLRLVSSCRLEGGAGFAARPSCHVGGRGGREEDRRACGRGGRSLRPRQRTANQNSAGERPKPPPPEEPIASGLGLHEDDELLGHWAPLDAVRVPHRVRAGAPASFAVRTGRHPKAGKVAVDNAARPNDGGQADCTGVQVEQSRQHRGIQAAQRAGDCGIEVDRAERNPYDAIPGACKNDISRRLLLDLCSISCQLAVLECHSHQSAHERGANAERRHLVWC